MKKDKVICILKKCGNKSIKQKPKKGLDPYVLYKLDSTDKKNRKLAKEIADKLNGKTAHKYVRKIIENGEQCSGIKLSMINDGCIISTTSDKLYGIYKEFETNDLYVVMFIQYDDIKRKLMRMHRK